MTGREENGTDGGNDQTTEKKMMIMIARRRDEGELMLMGWQWSSWKRKNKSRK